MAKSSSGSVFSRVGLGGVALVMLGCYVIFMCLESHRRSSFLDDLPSPTRILSSVTEDRLLLKACKSVVVRSRDKDRTNSVSFLLDSRLPDEAPSGKGINVVTLDPGRQVVLDAKNYNIWDGGETATAEFASDLSQLSDGIVVLVAVDSRGMDRLVGQAALDALHGLGSSISHNNFQGGYALIGIKGGTALAEGQGNSAQALSVLPCNGELAHSRSLRGQEQHEEHAAPPVEAEHALTAALNKDTLDEAANNAEQPEEDKKLLAGDKAEEKEDDDDNDDNAEHDNDKAKDKNQDKDQGKNEAAGAADEQGATKIPQGPIEGSPETSVRCVGGDKNRSCLFKNLYYHRGQFVMFVTKNPTTNMDVYRADKYEGHWRPDVQRFSDVSAIEKRLKSAAAVLEERGLSVQFNPLFHHNIGHAIFDGLYPAFVATVKLKVQDRPWRPVVAVDAGCFDEPSQGGLKPGMLIEAYLPHPKHGRTLRVVRARVTNVPQVKVKDPECSWEEGSDHNGLDLGSINVAGSNSDQKDACTQACAQSFGCQAAVLFERVCYLKGEAGSVYGKGGRMLCLLKGERPKAMITVMPEPGYGGEMKAIDVPEAWITGQVRRRCMSEPIYEMFGGVGEIRRLFELERDCRNYPNLLIRFEEVVIGVGGAGNMVADRSGAIGGSQAPHYAMSQFRDRMLRSYGLPVTSGVTPVPADQELRVIVISNKRFMHDDRKALDDIIANLNHKGGVKAEFIDWGHIGNPSNKFKEHLKKTQKADIYVSSIGTALQYVPFMQDGKVYIALGSVWMRSGQYFPTFMEQQLAGGGTPFLRTLYADPGHKLRNDHRHESLGEDGFFCGVNGTLVAELMQQAEDLVRNGFKIPVDPEENLSIEGKILTEICRTDEAACNSMTALRNGAVYECALLLWSEAVVYEVGPWRNGRACGSKHHKLLRKLRRKYGLTGYGAPNTDPDE